MLRLMEIIYLINLLRHLHLAANFGCEILKYVPGRVSTEIDARLSFDTQKTLMKLED